MGKETCKKKGKKILPCSGPRDSDGFTHNCEMDEINSPNKKGQKDKQTDTQTDKRRNRHTDTQTGI